MEPDSNKRPTATNIYQKIGNWLEEMGQDDNDDDDDDNVVKRQFFEADNIRQGLESPIHPNDMYTSKSINTRKITEALKSKDIISISKITGSQRIEIIDD
ncbi:hypothetical protein F8M41_003936 [Gigaspora margarita]|uniref:Uncharacterized protein n=1 Tax=Gigaspora margarita TaxID=4874 RepID=A0A8H4A724_GIGMA|nr:hypothetical protein F8M41_003936 [Gigaspora margarita]